MYLLQHDPWAEDGSDVDFDETLSLHANAAELYWHQGQLDESQKLLDKIFEHANNSVQKGRAWIIQSKLLGQNGNMTGALTALRTSLLEFGLNIPSNPTWELCDEDYRNLKNEIQRRGIADFVTRPLSSDSAVSLMGAVMLEAISAAFWCDSLIVSFHVSQSGPCALTYLTQLYQMCIYAAKAHMNYPNTFPQIGLALAYFTLASTGRHGDFDFAFQMHDATTQLLNNYGDSYAIGRGLALSGIFVAHLRHPLGETVELFYAAIDKALVSGDKHQMLLSVGGIAALKLYTGDHLAEVEAYCANAPESFGDDWAQDLRGGTFLIGCQYVYLKSSVLSVRCTVTCPTPPDCILFN